MTKRLINCGHSGLLFGHYLTRGKMSPLVEPGIGIHEGEFTRSIGERLLKLLPGSEMLTPGPLNVTQKTRRDNVNWLVKLEHEDILLLSIHSNAACNSGWQEKASGARIFNRKKPIGNKNSYNRSVEAAKKIDQAFHNDLLPYPVRPRMEKNFSILKVNCASVLIECGFHDNRIDAAYMASETGRDEIADMIASGVR